MSTPKRRQFSALRDYISIIAGTAIVSFGIFNIHAQSGVTEGGIIGLVLLLNHWLGIPQSISTFLLDAACYLFGFKLLGKKFLKYSIVATVSTSIFYRIYEVLGPVLPDLTPHPFIAAIAGGLFVGIGVGLVVRVGAASGGDDALALAISHKNGWPLSRVYIFTDLAVLLLSLSYIPFKRIFFSLITVTISSLIIGRIECIGKVKIPAKKKA